MFRIHGSMLFVCAMLFSLACVTGSLDFNPKGSFLLLLHFYDRE